jgi:hypothetical protein
MVLVGVRDVDSDEAVEPERCGHVCGRDPECLELGHAWTIAPFHQALKGVSLPLLR